MINNKNENRRRTAGGEDGKKKGKNDPTRLLCGRICGVARTITYCLPSSSDRYIIQRFPVTAVAPAAPPRKLPFTTLLYHFMYIQTNPTPPSYPLDPSALHSIRCL